MKIRVRNLSASALGATLALGVAGCGGDEVKYEPRSAPSGVKADLPPVPNVPQKPIKQGDAYTVWGVAYQLRSRVHRKEVNGKKLTVTGYITKTNLPTAPACAVHEGGKADPEGCNAPVPAFWIGDTKDAPENESIKVMGWASNFARVYDAIEEYAKKDDAVVEDTFWGVKVPNPVPNVGAKVTVKGDYSSTFVRASTGTEADPIMGLLTFEEITYHEPPPEMAILPGMDEKKLKKKK
jgi:hypothetical protein